MTGGLDRAALIDAALAGIKTQPGVRISEADEKWARADAKAVVDAVLPLIAARIDRAAYDSAMLVGESPMPAGSWQAGNDHGRGYGLRSAAELVRSFGGEQS